MGELGNREEEVDEEEGKASWIWGPLAPLP